MTTNALTVTRMRRKLSIRKKISGTAERPRLSFYRSLKGISVQAIDDRAQRTLFAHSVRSGRNMAAAKELAEKIITDKSLVGQRHFVFDRNAGAYHGVIQVFCETLRENGFKI